MSKIKSSSLYLNISETDKLHIKKISTNDHLPPAVFIHGVAENGRIFYSKSLKGVAPFFSKNYTCYIVDLRGKGESSPCISKSNDFNHKDVVLDLEKVMNFIKTFHPKSKQLWVAHSWGGVLINSLLLRRPNLICTVSGLIFFGTKRSISIKSLRKFFYVNFFYNIIFTLVGTIEGFVSSRLFGFDNEAISFHKDVVKLAKVGRYIEPSDLFDYEEAVKEVVLPKCLTIAGISDHFLGNPIDVKRFMDECHQDYTFWLLSKENVNMHDYGHNDMLTHADALRDHLPKVLKWIESELTF